MSLLPLQDFNAASLDATCAPIPNGQDLPKEMDIFFRNEAEFLPAGKTFNDLTLKEKIELRNKYRFDPFRPGVYQGITGLGGMV